MMRLVPHVVSRCLVWCVLLATPVTAQQVARVSMQVRSNPGTRWSQAVDDAQVILARIGSADTVRARTNRSGSATVLVQPGSHVRVVRKMGYEYLLDTITVAAGAVRSDDLTMSMTPHCLGQECLSPREAARRREQYRRIASSPQTWRCVSRTPAVTSFLEFAREQMLASDTPFGVPLRAAQRRAGPRLVTDHALCRRIAARLRDMHALRTATPLVIRMGHLYLVHQDGGLDLTFTRRLRLYPRMILQ